MEKQAKSADQNALLFLQKCEIDQRYNAAALFLSSSEELRESY